MSINMINEEILRSIKSDKMFNEELSEFLNFVIDEEIAKGDEMDDELVSECVDALMELEQGDIDSAIEKLGGSKKIIKFVHKKNFDNKRITRTVAAAVSLVLLTNVAAVAMPQSAIAQSINTFIEWVLEELHIDENAVRKHEEIASISVWYDGEMKVHSKDEIDKSKMHIIAYGNDGNALPDGTVKITDCEVSEPEKIIDDGVAYYSVSVKYDNVNGYVITFEIVE